MITDNAPIFGLATATAAQAVALVEQRKCYYEHDALVEITGYYWQYAPPVCIDPNKAFAQCLHETGEHYPTEDDPYCYLSSWWAQRPRRNPAGIGVNGVAQAVPPPINDGYRWCYDRRSGVYRHGYGFSTWRQAARMHLGWLLLFCLADGAGTPTQQALIADTLRFRGVPFPFKLRGSVTCLRELGADHNRTGMGWADPGTHYGTEIATIAQAISEVRV